MGALDGRIAVVTGGGRGIGRAFAQRFAAEGATVVISSRTRADLDEVAAATGGRAHPVVADAMDPDGARQPVREAVERFGAVDVVVNNVGGTQRSFEDTLVLNLVSAWWTTDEALPHMRARRWGRVINIGSGASRHAAASLGYTAAKHGLVGFTKQLAQDVGTEGITVNCLCPGWTDTSLIDWDRMASAKGVTPEVARQQAEGESAQRRILPPDELAGAAVLLASEDGRGITGQIFGVDGGYRL